MVKKILEAFRALTRDNRGVTAMEYALLLGAIAILIIASVRILGANVSTIFVNANSDIYAG